MIDSSARRIDEKVPYAMDDRCHRMQAKDEEASHPIDDRCCDAATRMIGTATYCNYEEAPHAMDDRGRDIQ